MQTELLRLRNISKSFPGVQALKNVDFSLRKGEIMALVGENGAGKTTLMKVLTGVHRRDEGEISLNGEPVNIQGPLDAQNMGISIIYQELNVILNLNIIENIFIGREKKRGLFIDKKQSYQEAQHLLDLVGLHINPTTLVKDLSISQRQMVEVARALSLNAQIIVMDEPTSSLTDTETDILFGIMRTLKEQGVSIIFISHRMNEIFQIADAVTVMRDGENVGVFYGDDIDEHEIVSLMVGREINTLFVKEEAQIGNNVMEVRDLATKNLLRDINFYVRRGEILGFAGLMGSGRTEVMNAVFGVDPRNSGDIFIEGAQVDIQSPEDAIRHGVGLVPEDRKAQALVLGMSVKENITLAYLKKISRFDFINKSREDQVTQEYIQKLQIKTPGSHQKVMNLSGGNQQKVVMSKWLATQPKVLILDEPTRGIDVGAKKEIHSLMSQLAQQGVAIIMISSEMPEILGMSDRIIVMHEGRIKGELLREEATQEKLMKLAIL